MVSSTMLRLMVIPAIYGLVKGWELPARVGRKRSGCRRARGGTNAAGERALRRRSATRLAEQAPKKVLAVAGGREVGLRPLLDQLIAWAKL